MAELTLVAPLAGWSSDLDEVDDPVFAGRMLGDGLAIDPTSSELRAPCDGEVLSVHAAGHAVTLRAANGAEILMHVGLETVGMGGEGFARHVKDGQAVRRGDLLISFDLDVLAARAKSLVTPIVITNGEDFAIERRVVGRRVAAGDPVLVLSGGAAVTAMATPVVAAASRRAKVPLAHGLHARPAALVAAEAKRHAAEITLAAHGRTVSGKSPVAIMSLGLALDAEVEITARGADAETAAAAVAELIDHGLPPEPPAAVAPPPPPVAPEPPADGRLRGTPAAPGLAIGAAVRLRAAPVHVDERSQGPEAESPALAAALAAVRARLTAQAAAGPREQREIVRAHLAFLDDEELVGAAEAAVASGASAGVAWRQAIGSQVAVLRGIADAHIAQRADDLVDLERQVLIELSGEPEPRQALPTGAIVLADDLGPGQLMALEGGLAGICTAAGGPTSHVAILASARGIPAVVAVGPALDAVPEGVGLILDGEAGLLRVSPDTAEIEAAQMRLAEREARMAKSQAEAAAPGRLADGTRIEVFANLGSEADARAAVAAGAEGCGLLRTEFLFLDRAAAPDEDEQAGAYQAIADAMEGRPLVIRTLDVGGDKPAPYLDLPAEENPALGLRGVRIGLAQPEFLSQQLRAILRVRPEGQVRILIPMVASLSELRTVKALIDAARSKTGSEAPVQLGVMVETPAAAVTADLLAGEADFLSIGTNDLTQYGLAMDRGNPAVAAGVDALHPAVLRLIAETCRGASSHNRQVAVCGGLAADPQGAAILIGLGVTELSAPPGAVPELKARLRTLTLADCQALAEQALACAGPAEVRALIVERLGGRP
jgi:multiphosphoryl transfer protein